MYGIRKLVSGGQTGADRAALDVAIVLDIDHGGWVPLGRWAEDGPLDPRYHVEETDSGNPAIRTEWNVRDADATLLFSHGPLTGGSALTLSLAQRLGKPFLHIDFNTVSELDAEACIRNWLQQTSPTVLNVAGPRASTDPLIYDRVKRVLEQLMRTCS